MNLAELKDRLGPTAATDAALEGSLNAAYQALVARYGDSDDEIVERKRAPAGPLLGLNLRAADITSVLEGRRQLLLQEDDYELRPGRRILVRLSTGSNPSRAWTGPVEVRYFPDDDTAERDRVALALVKLDLDHHPGLVGQTIGTWSETYSKLDTPYETEREAIIASLRDPFQGAM